MVALSNHMQNLENKTRANAQVAQFLFYDFYGNDHPWKQCPLQTEITNFIENYNMNQNNPYSKTYT